MAAVSNSNILGMLGQFVDVVKKAQIPNFVVVALGAPIIRGFSPGPSGRALTLLVLTSLAGAVAVQTSAPPPSSKGAARRTTCASSAPPAARQTTTPPRVRARARARASTVQSLARPPPLPLASLGLSCGLPPRLGTRRPQVPDPARASLGGGERAAERRRHRRHLQPFCRALPRHGR